METWVFTLGIEKALRPILLFVFKKWELVYLVQLIVLFIQKQLFSASWVPSISLALKLLLCKVCFLAWRIASTKEKTNTKEVIMIKQNYVVSDRGINMYVHTVKRLRFNSFFQCLQMLWSSVIPLSEPQFPLF